MRKVTVGDIFELINPFYGKYRLLFVGGNGYIFVSYYDLFEYSDYYVKLITSDVFSNGKPFLSFVLEKP